MTSCTAEVSAPSAWAHDRRHQADVAGDALELVETSERGQLIMALRGRLDSRTCRAVEDRLTVLLDGGTNVIVLDFADLEYISSAGLSVLLMVAGRLNAVQGRLAIAALRGEVEEVFELSGFAKVFGIFPSRAEALR